MMTFKKAMLVPSLVTLGCGMLLLAQNLSLVEVSYAAPADAATGAVPAESAPADGAGAGPKARRKGPNGAAGAKAPADPAAALGPEFGGPELGGPTIIRAVTEGELARAAAEASGREDPFMALVPPDPSQIVPPPVAFPSIKPVLPIAALPPGGLPAIPGVPGGAAGPGGGSAKPTPAPKPTVAELPWAGDKAPAAAEPQWIVRGIMATGIDRVTLLEGKEESLHARVGDQLSDGSRVEAISTRGVTFTRGGRRFVKLIGGNN
jgi:hypothetical protein